MYERVRRERETPTPVKEEAYFVQKRSDSVPQEETWVGSGSYTAEELLCSSDREPNPRLPIQRKLTVGAAGDKYEQEADRVARQVVKDINSPKVKEEKTQSGTVQRKITLHSSSVEGGEVSREWEGELNRARGGGQPLASEVKEPMEGAFGSDFSDVRVHADSKADGLARSIQAKAFTTGRDVFFQQGAYQPGSRGGQELLAHELTHVVQQNDGGVRRSPPPQCLLSPPPTTEIPEKRPQIRKSAQFQSVIRKYDKTNFNKIKSLVDSYSNNEELKNNVNDPGKFNEKLSSLKGYKKLSEEEQEMVKEQVKMKIRHQTLDTVIPEDQDDIRRNFNSQKSCVITALMYAEGGKVLGTSSVEGLHYILYTQFPKWAQYSDDDVLAQIYEEFGYETTTFSPKNRKDAVTDHDKKKGMTSSTGKIGHMVGFKKDKNSYKFRDNDHGEDSINSHKTKNDIVNKIWWK
ncbi:MAG: DUF4157 domain-containing protein [Spirulina sp.]